MLLLENFHGLTLYPENAARLKELVLQLAVQGKLTEGWRRLSPNQESASELLQRILQEKAKLVKEGKIKKEKPLEPISANEVPYDLPEGWVWCRLGDYLQLITDGSHFSPPTSDNGYPYITVRDVDWAGNIDFVGCKKITKTPFEELTRSGCKPERLDVLFSKDGTVGKTAVVLDDTEFVVLSSLAILRPFQFGLDSNFLKILLTSPSVLGQAIDMKSGSALRRIVLAKIKQLMIPVAPLVEQQAIVNQVEELMSQIAELEQHTAERIHLKQQLGAAALQQLTEATGEALEEQWAFLKAHFHTLFDDRENVKKLRESILQLAVQGKLTEAWRRQQPVIEPASELLKRIQQEKEKLLKEGKLRKSPGIKDSITDRAQIDIPNNWSWVKSDDIFFITKLAGFEYTKYISLAEQGEVPVIRAQNVRPFYIDKTNLLYIDEGTSYSLERSALTKPCLLATFIGAGIGDVALFSEKERWHLAPNVAKIEPFERCEQKVELEYFNICFSSAFGRKELFKHLKSTAQPSISMGTIRDVDMPFPPLAEQQAIVARVEELMKLCNELDQQVEKQKGEAERLMQALVGKVLESETMGRVICHSV